MSEEVAGELTYQGFAAALPRYLQCAPDCSDEKGPVWMFFSYGMYAEHLRKFRRHFEESRMLVLRSEDLYADANPHPHPNPNPNPHPHPNPNPNQDFYADAWPVVEQVYRFAGLPILDGLQEGVRRSGGKHNAGSLWGGKSYTGKLQVTRARARLSLARARAARLAR